MRLKPHIWTVDEIINLPEFGGKVGWFNGLVKDEGKLYWTEIFPGMGYAKPDGSRVGIFPSSWTEIKLILEEEKEDKGTFKSIFYTLKSFYRAVIDIFRYHPGL